MALDLDALKQPISAEQPCGPDLELEGDPDYMNLVARTEGLLPESFFGLDRSTINFKAEIEALGRLLERTRDLRLLVLMAKLSILDRDLGGFADCMAATGALLQDRWPDVHPKVDDGDGSLRAAILQTLDDLPTVILPLQYAPLLHSRRAGPVSYRSHMIASGEVARRAQEEAPDRTALDLAFAEAELPELIGTRDQVERLRGSVARIRAACIENGTVEEAPGLERLAPLTESLVKLLDGIVAGRDPAAALDGRAGAPAVETAEAVAASSPEPASLTASVRSAGQVATPREAAAVLASVAEFLARHEPSNPALLLVRQAEQLVGKSIVEIIRILVPDMVKDAKIGVGPDQPIAFPVERLATLVPDESAKPDGPEPDRNGYETAAQGRPAPRTRAEAMGLLDQVAGFYRAAEPSNPIPLLVERARALSSLDFLSLLKEISPKRK